MNGVETTSLRYKSYKNNCILDWKSYDQITLEDHLRAVGCKTPDQITDSPWPVCSSNEMMKKARIPLVNDKIRPCRSVESVSYKVIRILNPRFKETIQYTAVDIETLVGYIGGYIGILTGFALIQIPDQMQVANPVLILLFIPLFDYAVYPLLSKFDICIIYCTLFFIY